MPGVFGVARFHLVVPDVDGGRRSLISVSVGPVGCRWRQWLLVAEAELEGGGRRVLVGEGKIGGNKK